MTNKYHYVLNENIKDETILGRLIHKYEDQHRYIKKKLYDYRTFMHSMTVEYAHQLISVNAEQPVQDVYRNFTEAIELSHE